MKRQIDGYEEKMRTEDPSHMATKPAVRKNEQVEWKGGRRPIKN